MKFSSTVVVSVLAHIGLFSLFYLKPAEPLKKGVTYYVDLVSMPGGGDGRAPGGGRPPGGARSPGTRKAEVPQAEKVRVRDLTVAKESTESELRFPDQKKKPAERRQAVKPKAVKEKKAEKMVTVVTRKEPAAEKGEESGKSETGKKGESFLRIGVGGEGSGQGSGDGSGSGEGSGDGRGWGFGPGGPGGGGNYYFAVLQNKIKNAWFNTAIASGDGARVAYIACRIARGGGVSDVRVYQSSGDESLDASGLRAVRRAAPFPPFPASNPNRYIDVIFEFEGRKR